MKTVIDYFQQPYKMRLNIAFLALLAITTFSSCDHDRNKPGYTYFPDMEESQAYETYSSNPNTKNGATNQQPVKGTVPREMIPYDFEKTPENKKLAGVEYQNPIKPTKENLDEGKRLYAIYCTTCHGNKGDGKGFLYTSGKYPFPPASLLTEKVQNVPDGETFHVISVGIGVMGAHNSQLTPQQRWLITSYVKGF